jgi:hypothetical protein
VTEEARTPPRRRATAPRPARPTPAGYSGTPLAKKLGIKAGTTLRLVDAPAHFEKLLEPLPDGVRVVPRVTADTDIVHVFATARREFARTLATTLRAMRGDAAIWVSWPKKASGVATDITEDGIREIALPLGLVDIKVCAVDGTWSGLKLVIRRANRASRR